ncbi:hypothetical protein GOP47_0023341 [Adiantum capillus-veneris]|uniref:Uncharacterized protein n=1 Tax=Adiantum capillus-veneris TaxID=13818 RepID=A0A9D4Z5T7_ADICA|nr:hypothetical protein GOP47_0023341 [Adiantum capillus-veneris]
MLLQVHEANNAANLSFKDYLGFATTTEGELSDDDLDQYGFLEHYSLWDEMDVCMDSFPDVEDLGDSLDAFQYLSNTFFSFDEKMYSLMVNNLVGIVIMSLSILKAHDVRGMMNLKRWNRMRDDLSLCPIATSQQLYLQLKSSGLKIAYIEDWARIVRAAHCPSRHEKHLGVVATINAIKTEWCIDTRKHGISHDYIRDSVIACGCLLEEKAISHDVSSWPACSWSTTTSSTSIETTLSQVEPQLANIMIKHQTRLVLVRSTKKHGLSKWMQEYMCHRWGSIQRKGAHKRRDRKSKRRGCGFKVVIQHFEEFDKVIIKVQGEYAEHDWTAMLTEALRLQELKKVIFVQPYNPRADDECKRPFILVIQDEDMLEIAIRFSCHNSWAVDRQMSLGYRFMLQSCPTKLV